VTVPLILVSRGNENAVGVSASWDVTKLTLTGVSTEGIPSGITAIVNTNAIALGRMGVLAGAGGGSSFPAGTNLLAQLTFAIAAGVASPSTVEIVLGDSPIIREVTSVTADVLPADFVDGRVEVTSGIEADLVPRPLGNRSLSPTDFTLLGRLVAQLEPTQSESEFMRADCAPRSSRGDGRLTPADLTQGGRYVAGLDDPQSAGGPGTAANGLGAKYRTELEDLEKGLVRSLRLVGGVMPASGTVSVPVQLQGLGNENALGGTVLFAPQSLRFIRADSAAGLSLIVNPQRTNEGRVGLLVSLPANSAFPAGTSNVVTLTFEVLGNGPVSLSWVDGPVFREVASVLADVLTTDFIGGTLTTANNPPAVLSPQVYFGISVTGTIGVSFRIESAATAAGPWVSVGSVQLTNSPQTWIDSSAPAGSSRIYRAVSP
jgi:hypothetical protein